MGVHRKIPTEETQDLKSGNYPVLKWMGGRAHKIYLLWCMGMFTNNNGLQGGVHLLFSNIVKIDSMFMAQSSALSNL